MTLKFPLALLLASLATTPAMAQSVACDLEGLALVRLEAGCSGRCAAARRIPSGSAPVPPPRRPAARLRPDRRRPADAPLRSG